MSRRLHQFGAFLLVAALAACGSDGGTPDATNDADAVAETGPDALEDTEAEATPDATDGWDQMPVRATLPAGDYGLTFDSEKIELVLTRDETPLLRFPADGLQLGRVDSLMDLDGNDTQSFDPWPMYPAAQAGDMYTPPAGLAWLAPTAAEITEVDGIPGSFVAVLTYPEGKKAELRVSGGPPAPRFEVVLQPLDGGPAVAYVRLRGRVDETEGFYGLGAFFDHVEHRGWTVPLQLEADFELEGKYNEAHVRVPFVLGTTGWGMFVETYRPAVFDMATQADDLVEVTVGTGADTPAGLPIHLFAADHPIDVTKHYYEVTGYPSTPGRWALGPLFWRDEVDGQEAVLADLRKIRDLDLASSAYWIDRPYATEVNTFDFKPSKYADPAAMIQTAHDLGFRFSVWHSPYPGEKTPATADLNQHAIDNGFYPPVVGLLLNNWGRPVDFTNADAFAWWQGLIRRYTDMGVEGFKLDYGEDVIVGLMGLRSAWQFHDGSDERTQHRKFNLLLHRAYRETMPQDGGFILARNGGWGDQANIDCVWPGDADSSFAAHREVVTLPDGETYVSVGGLPATVMYGLSLGPSGYPYFGSDTGGYRHAAPPDKELFTRWMQQTALSSVMQVGNDSSSMPWEFESGGKPLYDEESLGWYREYSRLHLRLWPYEWTYVKRIPVDGRPIERPIGLVWPELGVHPEDEYLLGEHLLVAPVMKRGLTGRDVYLPPGSWIDWFDDVVHEGGKTVAVDAPLSKAPLFLAQGGIVPLLRPTIDTLAPVKDPLAVDSYATTAGVIHAVTLPGAKSTFTLFDGSSLSQERTGDGLVLRYADGGEFRLGALFEARDVGTDPTQVTIDGAAAAELDSLAAVSASNGGWWRDSAKRRLHVKVGPGTHEVVAKVAW